jgi:transcriptional regulator with XRE-family HTH domain
MTSNTPSQEINPEEIRRLRDSNGMTQKQFASELGVSQLTIARWETGERACKGAAAQKIREMQRAATLKFLPTTALATVTNSDLDKLDANASVDFIREFLACEARRLNISPASIEISKRQISDGGIDCRVRFFDKSPSWANNNKLVCFQIKSGKTDKPWTNSWIKKELEEKKSKALGEEIERCFKENGLYIAIFTGVDLTPKQISESKEHFISHLKTNHFTDAQVEIWGQSQLINMVSQYPSLSMQINGGLDLEFQCAKSWSQNHDMSLKYSEDENQRQVIEEIKTALLKEDAVHLILTGDPGIGKTRVVHEAIKDDMIAPMVIYIENSEDFLKTKIYNHILRVDNSYTLILILDNCPLTLSRKVWNTLRNRSNRCKLITVQTETHTSNDKMELVVRCPALSSSTIGSIIESYTNSRPDTQRWERLCSGSPSYAHILGKNLALSPSSVLSSVEAAYGFLSEDELVVIRHLALFNKFGFGPNYEQETKAIYKLIEENAGLKTSKTQEIINKLQIKGLIKGANTCFITPKIMQIQLWKDFWESHGDSITIESILNDSFPDRLQDWFIDMVSYTHLTERAISKFRAYLSQKTSQIQDSFLASSKGTRLLSKLAEADPNFVLHSLKIIFNKWSPEEVRDFTSGRQNIVFALEKLAHHSKYFSEAAILLLKFAKSDNSSHSNNALGTFIDLFSLAPGLVAPTASPPNERLEVLKEIIFSDAENDFDIALRAFQKALSHPIHSGFRIVGAEYQGLHETIVLWTPENQHDFQNSYKFYWQYLASIRDQFNSAKTKKIIAALISSAEYLLLFEWLDDTILQTLHELVEDELVDHKQLVDIIESTKRYRSERVNQKTIDELNRLDQKITGDSLIGKIKRNILYSTYNEFDSEEKKEYILKKLVNKQLLDSDPFIKILPQLIRGENMMITRFSYEIAKLDKKRNLWDAIIKTYQSSDCPTPYFIGGYLKKIHETDKEEWNKLVLPLVLHKKFTSIIGLILSESGITDPVLESLLDNFESMNLPVRCLLNISHAKEIHKMSYKNIIGLVNLLRIHSQYECAFDLIMKKFNCSDSTFPEEFASDLIIDYLQSDNFSDISDHACGELINHMIEHKFYPDAFFKPLVHRLFESKQLMSRHSKLYEIIIDRIRNAPNKCWESFVNLLNNYDEASLSRLAIKINFSSFRINLFPEDSILKWIAQKPIPRAAFIAKLIPQNLSSSSKCSLGRELLDRYGDQEELQEALIGNFIAGEWCGDLTNFYKSKLEAATQWLQEETSLRIKRFLDKYIDTLLHQIKWAEAEAERDL